MGRRAEGPRTFAINGWYYYRFTWKGHDYRQTCDTRDRSEAEETAARAYSDVVSGRVAPLVLRPGKLHDFGELWDQWREWKRASIDPETYVTLGYYGDRFVDCFGSLDRVTEANGATYGMMRLGQVSRSTVLKELCFLRQFTRWAHQQGALTVVPNIPGLPPKAKGKRSGKQRKMYVEITPEQAADIIALLPQESKTIDGRTWPIRDRFAFTWETALRPETIDRISVPENWRRGQKCLVLADEDDKARFGRTLDLTPAALRILRRWAPKSGRVFGAHNFAKALKAAAKAVLGSHDGAKFAPYDFRHARAKQLLDAGAPLRGVSYLVGHTRPTTTDRYTRPDRRVGREALRVVG